jgi:integrase
MTWRTDDDEIKELPVKKLPVPAKGNKVYYDIEVAGFGIRITAAAARSFILNYYTTSGRERRITVGDHREWTLTEARKEALRLRHLISKGGDPVADKKALREAPTVADLIDRFEAEHLPRLRASTAAEYRLMISKYVGPHFGSSMKAGEVTFADVDRLHRRITAAGFLYRANRVASVLSKMFALAVRWGMRTDNPCKGVERNREAKRKRYLSGDELGRLVAALARHPDRQAADIIRLLLLTGARRGEVLGMRWADVDLGTGVWSKMAESVKQKEDHITPISAPARQMLSEIRARQQQASPHKPLGEFVFPGANSTAHRVYLERAWKGFCKAAKIEGLRIHDIRHSFASTLVSSGHTLPLIGALLGHASVSSTARYSHLFSDPLKQAVESVGRVIEQAAGGGGNPAAEVVPLKPGGRRP